MNFAQRRNDATIGSREGAEIAEKTRAAARLRLSTRENEKLLAQSSTSSLRLCANNPSSVASSRRRANHFQAAANV